MCPRKGMLTFEAHICAYELTYKDIHAQKPSYVSTDVHPCVCILYVFIFTLILMFIFMLYILYILHVYI